ncbi:MAG: cytochrome c1 [Alphaproteobacteria bacterium]|nr:cytochrome c1 [Alphaproteobacteria bacterium]
MRPIAALALCLALAGGPALAAGDTTPPKSVDWPHGGPFGTFDRAALQRGFLVYKQVCAACHGLRQVAYRNLNEIGFNEAQVKVLAAEVEVQDGPNDQGEMFNRPGRPSDRFRSPFANPQAARAANNGALPPDLSLITKARAGGGGYIYSLLTGYRNPPAEVKLAEGMSYNPYFAGRQIAMAPPLNEGAVEFADGTKAGVEQMAWDVTTFLAWAAEPEMEARKRMGVKVILFLLVLTGVLYAVKRKVWAEVH